MLRYNANYFAWFTLYGKTKKIMTKTVTRTINIRKCRAEAPLSAWLRRSQKSRRYEPPTQDKLPYKAFAGSPLSAIVKLEKI